MRIGWLLLLAGVLLAGWGFLFGNQSAGNPDWAEIKRLVEAGSQEAGTPGPSLAELGEKVFAKYRSLSGFSFTAVVSQWPENLSATAYVAMKPDALRTEIWINGKLDQIILRPGGQTEGDGGGWEFFAGREVYGCLLGTLTETWLHPEARTLEIFRRRIKAGRFLGAKEVAGESCQVILCDRKKFWDLFYIRNDGLITRWVSCEFADGQKVPQWLRTREYRDIKEGTPGAADVPTERR